MARLTVWSWEILWFEPSIGIHRHPHQDRVRAPFVADIHLNMRRSDCRFKAGIMIAMTDYRIPTLFDEETAILAVVFSLMAFLVSPLSPLNRRIRERLTAFYLPAIFIWWYFFQNQLMSIHPGLRYYLSHSGRFKWMMKSDICYAFGFAFSLGLIRLSRDWPRVVGFVFAVLFLLLILGGEGCGPPPIQET